MKMCMLEEQADQLDALLVRHISSPLHRCGKSCA